MSVEVMSGGGSANLQVKYATPSAAAQNIEPDSGYDGLERVLVNGDSDLAASNIKKGVSIFNVTGTLEPAKSTISFSATPTTVNGKVCIELPGIPSTATKIYGFFVNTDSSTSGTYIQSAQAYANDGVSIQSSDAPFAWLCGATTGNGAVLADYRFFRSDGKVYLWIRGQATTGLYTMTFATSATYSVSAMYE